MLETFTFECSYCFSRVTTETDMNKAPCTKCGKGRMVRVED